MPCMPTSLVVHPVLAELRSELAVLRRELAHALLSARDLEIVTKPYLLALYESKLGDVVLRLLHAEARFARARRFLEEVRAMERRGVVPDRDVIDEELDRLLAEHHARLIEARLAHEQALRDLANAIPHERFAEAKRLYRKLVQRLHPDVNPAQSAADLGMFHRATDAYDACDVEALVAIADALDADRDVGGEPMPLEVSEPFDSRVAALQALAASLRAKILATNEGIAATRAKPPFDLLPLLEDPARVASERARFELEARSFEERAIDLERRADEYFGGDDDAEPACAH